MKGIKATFGAGEALVEIFVEGDETYQGGKITGRISASAYRQEPVVIKELALDLKEFTLPKKGKETRFEPYSSLPLGKEIKIEPGKARVYPFEFELPENARVSLDDSGWIVACKAVADQGVEREGILKLNVLPSINYRALSRTLFNKMGFVEKKMKWKEGIIEQKFAPPDYLKPKLEFFQIIASNKGEKLKGKARFIVPTVRIDDNFQTVITKKKIDKQLDISRKDVTAEGRIDQEKTLEFLKKLFSKVNLEIRGRF